MKATIVTIGSEILAGDIVNTNAWYYSLELKDLGFEVDEHISIDDDFERIEDLIGSKLGQNRLVLTTGGLGPTKDDMTKAAIARALGKDLIKNEESYERIKSYFDGEDYAMEENLSQAYFPQSAKVLANHHGTADGFFYGDERAKIMVLPGPPRENRPMFESYGRAYLEGISKHKKESRYYRIFGIGEWETEAMIQDLIEGPDDVATFARREGLFIKVSLDISLYLDTHKRFAYYEGVIRKKFGDKYLSEGISLPEELLGFYLIEKGLRVSSAESITGGLIASKLVGVGGISACLKESYVTYSNEVKEKILGVKKETIEKYGVVSGETVGEMLKGLKNISGSDLCIATSGYAGPGEGAGKVFFGVLYKDRVHIEEKLYQGPRNDIRARTANDAILTAYKILKEEN